MAKKSKKSTKSQKQPNDKKDLLQDIKQLNNHLEEMHQSKYCPLQMHPSRQLEFPIEIHHHPSEQVEFPLEMHPLNQIESPMEILSSKTIPIEMDLSFLSPPVQSKNIVLDDNPFTEISLPSKEMVKDDTQCQRLKKQVKRQNKVIDVLLDNLET